MFCTGKMRFPVQIQLLLLSLPTREAWIEIFFNLLLFNVYLSLPTREAWIEITRYVQTYRV